MVRIVNKVIDKSSSLPETLLDLTNDTVSENNLLQNKTAHNSEGEPVIGTLQEGGTEDYNDLSNKPQINGNSLSGNKTGSQLGLQNIILSSALTIGGQTVTEVEPALRALNEKGGGHTIVDSENTVMPQRSKLKFVGCTVTDDSEHDTTIVEAEGGGGGTIVVVPTVTNTSITYDGTQKSPTITRDTDHTYIQGDYQATNYGTYTFTIGLTGVNDVWSDTTTAPKSYTWSINYDGGTITPVNDIQTWLKCANIDDKAYTTLSEVLVDSTTLAALMLSHNAVDYLVRSTSWVSDITANQTAMTDIGSDDYCADTLLADSTWLVAICNSTYFESVLNVKVPAMTSLTTPSGEVIYSPQAWADVVTPAIYRMFDTFTNNSAWIATASNCYIGYIFPQARKINYLVGNYACTNATTGTVKFQGSNDGNNWDDIETWNDWSDFKTGQTSAATYSFKHPISNSNSYQRYRLYATNYPEYYANGYGWRGNIQFYGR